MVRPPSIHNGRPIAPVELKSSVWVAFDSEMRYRANRRLCPVRCAETAMLSFLGDHVGPLSKTSFPATVASR